MTSKNKIIYAAWPYQSSILGVHNLIPMMRADAYARFSRLCKSKVTFITGFDELGSRTEKIAKNLKLRPIELLEKLYPANKDCLDKFSISYDVLGRTSDKYHYDFVMSAIEELIENKTIIQKEDTISYCTSCNNELVGSMIKGTCKNCGSVAIGDQCKSCNLLMTHNSLLHSKCTTCNNEVKFIKKNSWVLDLNNKSIKKNFKRYIESYVVMSEDARKITIKSLSDSIVVSQKSSFSVPLPDKSGYIYNWVDSLLADYSVLNSQFNLSKNDYLNDKSFNSFFFMGKDNIPYFTILLPSLLLNLNKKYFLPQYIVENSFMKFDGVVCSRSEAKGIKANEAIELQDTDCWRSFLLFSLNSSKDVNFDWEKFSNFIDCYLIDKVEVFINNILQVVIVDKKELKKESVISKAIIDDTTEKVNAYIIAMEEFDFTTAMNVLLALTSLDNLWVKSSLYNALLYRVFIFSVLCLPIMPKTAQKIWDIYEFKFNIDDVKSDDLNYKSFMNLYINKHYKYKNIQIKLFISKEAKNLLLEYENMITNPDLVNIRGLGELCRCEGWGANIMQKSLTNR